MAIVRDKYPLLPHIADPEPGTAKFYKGYHLTNLGAEQLQASGLFYRDRYIKNGASRQILGISPDQYKESQVYGSAPDQTVSRRPPPPV